MPALSIMRQHLQAINQCLFRQLIVLCLTCTSFPLSAQNKGDVLFFLSSESAAYEIFRTRILQQKETTNSSYSNFLFYNINQLNQAEIQSLSKKAELVVTVGEKSAGIVSKLDIQIPHITTLLTQQDYTELLVDQHRNNRIECAVIIDQPQSRIYRVINEYLPDIKTVGIIEPVVKSRYNQSGNRDKVIHGINIIREPMNEDIHSTISNLSRHRIGAIVAMHDRNVYNARTARNILISSYYFDLPLIGYSSSFVKAGALIGIYSKPGSIADETYYRIINPNKCQSGQVVHSSEYTIEINPQVAKSLGIKTGNPVREKTINERPTNAKY